MLDAFIVDAIRTPIGRYGGALKDVRADDLGAIPIRELVRRNPDVDWSAIDDVVYGCANQAGEDNRNVAHMATLLAGLPVDVPGATINRLCGSGLDAVGTAARAIKSAEASLMIAGGVESMSRAPFVMPKAESAFSRANAVYEGVYLLGTKDGRHLFITGHSEYDPLTLKGEYDRDMNKGLSIHVPKNYYPKDDPTQPPTVRWRGHANLLFSNWLNYYVYQVTPYDVNQIPS
mgnify:CR=1 FL=1